MYFLPMTISGIATKLNMEKVNEILSLKTVDFIWVPENSYENGRLNGRCAGRYI